MPDDPVRYKLDPSQLGDGLIRSLYETLDDLKDAEPKEFSIYRTSLDDTNGEKFDVDITAEMKDKYRMRITENDSRYQEMEPLEGEIDLGRYKVVVSTNKLPYGLKDEFDPDNPPTPEEIRYKAREKMGDLMTEAVQRFVVGANYRVGIGKLTDEEAKESPEVPYNRKSVLEDLLKTIIIFGSGLSILWLLTNQKITAKVSTATGLATNAIYGTLVLIFVLGTLFLMRKPIIKLLGRK